MNGQSIRVDGHSASGFKPVRDAFIENFERQAGALHTSARLLDDGIVGHMLGSVGDLEANVAVLGGDADRDPAGRRTERSRRGAAVAPDRRERPLRAVVSERQRFPRW